MLESPTFTSVYFSHQSLHFLWGFPVAMFDSRMVCVAHVLLCYFCINMIHMFDSSKDFKTWNLIQITKDHVPRRYVASSPRKQISERMVFMGVPLAIWKCHGPKWRVSASTPLIHVGNGDVQHGFWIVWPICCNHASYFRQNYGWNDHCCWIWFSMVVSLWLMEIETRLCNLTGTLGIPVWVGQWIPPAICSIPPFFPVSSYFCWRLFFWLISTYTPFRNISKTYCIILRIILNHILSYIVIYCHILSYIVYQSSYHHIV